MGTSLTPLSPSASAPGVLSKASLYSVVETLDRLKQVVLSRGLQVFAEIDHSGAAEKAGLKMQEAHILIFGSPKAGTPLMIASPLLALDLPLKALVWQDLDGQVWVSYTSAAFLATRYAIPNDLVKNIAGIDGLIESALSGS